jgi:hypothetical protein
MNDIQTQSFIITIHTDDSNQDDIDWQAQIVHVLSGAEFTFGGKNQVEEMKAFIRPYLIDLGIDDPTAWLENNLSIQIDNR